MPQQESKTTSHRRPLLPLVVGVSRDAENPRAVIVACVRPPTDEELRAIHEAAKEATYV